MTDKPEIPMIHYYRGVQLEEMSREQLIEAVIELGKMYEDSLASSIRTAEFFCDVFKEPGN